MNLALIVNMIFTLKIITLNLLLLKYITKIIAQIE